MARKVIQHYHSTGGTRPDATNLYDGELALGIKAGEEKIFLKNTSDEVVEFIDSKAINSLIEGVQANIDDMHYTLTSVTAEQIYTWTTGTTLSLSIEDFNAIASTEKTVYLKYNGQPAFLVLSNGNSSGDIYVIGGQKYGEQYLFTISLDTPTSNSVSIQNVKKTKIIDNVYVISELTVETLINYAENGGQQRITWAPITEAIEQNKIILLPHEEGGYKIIEDIQWDGNNHLAFGIRQGSKSYLVELDTTLDDINEEYISVGMGDTRVLLQNMDKDEKNLLLATHETSGVSYGYVNIDGPYIMGDELYSKIGDPYLTQQRIGADSGITRTSATTADIVFVANFEFNYTEDNKLQIVDKDDNSFVITEFDASNFVKDGLLENAVYDATTNKLTLSFKLGVDGKKADIVVDLNDLVDVYKAGEGLTATTTNSGTTFDIDWTKVAKKSEVEAEFEQVRDEITSALTGDVSAALENYARKTRLKSLNGVELYDDSADETPANVTITGGDTSIIIDSQDNNNIHISAKVSQNKDNILSAVGGQQNEVRGLYATPSTLSAVVEEDVVKIQSKHGTNADTISAIEVIGEDGYVDVAVVDGKLQVKMADIISCGTF